MSHTKLFPLLVTLTLCPAFAGCSDDAGMYGMDDGFGEDADSDGLGADLPLANAPADADDDDADPSEADIDGTVAPAPDVPPSGRIIFMASEDEDLIVHATLGAEVQAAYEGADHYAIRFDSEAQRFAVSIVDVEGLAIAQYGLELEEDLSSGEPVPVVKFHFPFGDFPWGQNCTFPPCPEWPVPDGGTGLTITADAEGTVLAGNTATDVFEYRIYGEGEDAVTVQTVGGDPSQPSVSMLETGGLVLADLAPVVVEVGDDWPCAGCLELGMLTAGFGASCAHGNQSDCGGAAAGLSDMNDNCGGACE